SHLEYNRSCSSTTCYRTGGESNGRARLSWECVGSTVQFLHSRLRPALARTPGHGFCLAMKAVRGYPVVLDRATRVRRREGGRAPTSGFDSTRAPGTGRCNRVDQRDPSASGGG